MKILNFGSLNYDYVYRVKTILKPGETQKAISRELYFGGKGLNQSIALSKAGLKVYHAGNIGRDGDDLKKYLNDYNVNTEYINKVDDLTGHTVIQVSDDAENSILYYSGANYKNEKNYIDYVLEKFDKGDILLLQNEINCIDYLIDKAAEKEMRIFFNPSPFNDDIKLCDLSKIDIFLVNEIEGFQITGYSKKEEILKEFNRKYPKSKVMLTLGKNGNCYMEDGEIYNQDIYKVKAIDTTAAGDTFTGYFIYGIVNELEITDILKLASKASALAVTREGAAPSIPTFKEVEEYKL